MQLKKNLLTIPYFSRFSYDPVQHVLFENLEGLKIKTLQDAKELLSFAEQKLKEIAALKKAGTKKPAEKPKDTVTCPSIFQLVSSQLTSLGTLRVITNYDTFCKKCK